MDFINDNLVWIIIIGAVLLLALIGYVAEKQGFGTNTKKDKDDKESKKEDLVEVKDEEAPNTENNEPVFEDSFTFEEPPVEEGKDDDLDVISDEVDSFNEDKDNEVSADDESDKSTDEPIDISDQLEEPSNDDEVIDKNEDESIDEIKVDDEQSTEEKMEDKFNDDIFDEVNVVDPNIEEETNKNTSSDEDLYAPFGDKEFKKDEELNIDQDFNKILDDVDNVSTETNTTEENSDDDIWKF